MNDNSELESLRAQVTTLQAQVDHDNETRRELLSATDKLLPRLAQVHSQWEQRFAAHLRALDHAPELERLREEGLLPKMAALMTRQKFLEEQFDELRLIAVEAYTAVKELLAILRRGE